MRQRACFVWRWRCYSPLRSRRPDGAGTCGPAGWRPGGRQGGPPPVQLPDGAGREQVQAACTRCHGLNLIANSWGYTKDGWQDRIATMVKLPAAELEAISSYLATHFPIKDAPSAVLLSGPATVIDQGVDGAHAGLAAARLARRGGRVDLVDRSVCEQAWTSRPADGSDPRVRTPRHEPAARPGGGRTGQHLVHRHPERRHRPAGPARPARCDEYPLNEPGVRGPHTPILDKQTRGPCSSRCSQDMSVGSTPTAARW